MTKGALASVPASLSCLLACLPRTKRRAWCIVSLVNAGPDIRAPLRLLTLMVAMLLVVVACGGDEAGAGAIPSASVDPLAVEASPTPTPLPTADPEGEMCLQVAEMDERLASLRAVELKLPNRTTLEIELDKLQAAYSELEDVDFGVRRKELERSLTRLGYRMGELELAIEDFRTNTRPKRAAPHVEEDAQKVADELAAFIILSGC